MLEVVSLEEAREIVARRFPQGERSAPCAVSLSDAAGRTIAHDVVAQEGIPPFDRSTVDGFAVMAADTFGCSEALPALLEIAGEVQMGSAPACACSPGSCVRIPTGGALPSGADAVVMLEHCEEYGDGTVGIMRAAAPGDNVVFACDDVAPGETIVPAGTLLRPHHLGTLASLGITSCEVLPHMRVAVISTGDEIVPPDQMPAASQMRDVNTPVLAAAVRACGGEAQVWPIVPDRFELLLEAVRTACETCDVVLVSGGSSAGERDNTARVLAELGAVLFHGVAVKPGKPTLCADVAGVPVFGLPGHPVAAYFMFLELVRPLLSPTAARLDARSLTQAKLVSAVPSNHGRSEFVAVRFEEREGESRAVPIRSKSGLISQLAQADGYIVVDRNTEGLAAGTTVSVRLF